MRRRRGFTLMEAVASAAFIAIIVCGVAKTSMVIDTMRIQARDSVFLSAHNLNTMERLRQDCLLSASALMNYYSDAQLGSDTIKTEAYIEQATWDTFHVYDVKLVSEMRTTGNKLTSKYTITDIGGVVYEEEINPE